MDSLTQSASYVSANRTSILNTTNAGDSSRVVATMHPRYGHPLLQRPQMDGRLWWATTEAAQEQGGYLDGAIFIGRQVAAHIIKENAG